jgi:ATP-dependent Lon protease
MRTLCALQGFQVAVTFASVYARLFRSTLGLPAAVVDLPLWSSGTDIIISSPGSDFGKAGSSASLAGAVALACLLGRRSIRSDKIVMTGSLDLRGEVGGVGALDEKTQAAFEKVRSWPGMHAVCALGLFISYHMLC